MSKTPILAVMAAGMGSRYGGLKQLDPVGSNGEFILDFSMYDAVQAGFKKVVFIIKEEHEQLFRDTLGNRISGIIETDYAFQRPTDLPDGYSVPEGREKPWGTAQAVMALEGKVDAPFAVINADDYYGPNSFKMIFDFLCTVDDSAPLSCGMVGYQLRDTLTDNGTVSRGVCVLEGNQVTEIVERKQIARHEGVLAYTENGESWNEIPEDALASMNFFGFPAAMLPELRKRFPAFLDSMADPKKSEYLLPEVVGAMLAAGELTLTMLPCSDKWYGVTHKEDRPMIVAALQALKDEGQYPENLWQK